MAIDNNANWTSRIKGNATLGAASLAPDEFNGWPSLCGEPRRKTSNSIFPHYVRLQSF
jgi:hypothetical protein